MERARDRRRVWTVPTCMGGRFGLWRRWPSFRNVWHDLWRMKATPYSFHQVTFTRMLVKKGIKSKKGNSDRSYPWAICWLVWIMNYIVACMGNVSTISYNDVDGKYGSRNLRRNKGTMGFSGKVDQLDDLWANIRYETCSHISRFFWVHRDVQTATTRDCQPAKQTSCCGWADR